MPDFSLSEDAERHLTAIWTYIALDNLKAADRFLEAAYDTFIELANMPLLGRHRSFSSINVDDIRSFHVKGFRKYLILYRPTASGVLVLRVVHGARDLETA